MCRRTCIRTSLNTKNSGDFWKKNWTKRATAEKLYEHTYRWFHQFGIMGKPMARNLLKTGYSSSSTTEAARLWMN
jgi:hypothetical protein